MSQSSSARPVINADISRIIKYAPAELIGREPETKLLADAWDQAVRGETKRPHVLTFVALGGEGKTSLVAKWAADLAFQNWPGCDAAFAWSFYSQGTREQAAVSSDSFLAEALKIFGDPDMANSAVGAFDKGRRLAQLVGGRRALLILDGLEPLQYAPTSPTPGELKDQGVSALLKALATANNGLCVVTTRYAISDLRAYWQTTAPMHELLRLSTTAGVKLLRTIGVKTGSQADFEKLVEDVDGHALTLQIVGQFLVRAFQGDIRRRDRIDIKKADARIQGGHAFRAMKAYVKWLEDDSEEARREVAVLKLLGLFDRPAMADCVNALRQSSVIPGLTEPLVGLAEDDWEFSLTSLRDAKLLTVNRDQGSGELVALDAHPLLREYFARQLREQQPDAWRTAHRLLYKHLCATTLDKDEPTLEELQPLYQAVAHGCQAGLQQEVCEKVYRDRIYRRQENYVATKLGAFGSEMAAVACFFDSPWSRISSALSEQAQGWLLAVAAYGLRALGRLTEAIEPMRAGIPIKVRRKDWRNASANASNLSELELTLGELAAAMGDGDQAVTYADYSGDRFQRLVSCVAHADAMHQAGYEAEAEARFREAEETLEIDYPLLYGVAGFRYCDLLMGTAERAAWQTIIRLEVRNSELDTALATCRTVVERTARTRGVVESAGWLLDMALDELSIGRAALYMAILGKVSGPSGQYEQQGAPTDDESFAVPDELEAAVEGLRRAGTIHYIPRGLISRAWARFQVGAHTGRQSAQSDLDDAWEIAERGPMKLFMADIHLYRARLFGGMKDEGGGLKYPWDKNPDGTPRGPKDDLAAARKLIEQCGYWRRKEELEDAEAAAKNW